MAGNKSARSLRGRPFQAGEDPRRGRGPAKGAPNAGRPPDVIIALKREATEEAITQVLELLAANKLTPDQLIRIGKDFDPDDHKRSELGREPLTIRVVSE